MTDTSSPGGETVPKYRTVSTTLMMVTVLALALSIITFPALADDLTDTDLKQYALERINEYRDTIGRDSLTLSNSAITQEYAEDMLEHCYIALWNRDGLKPSMAYALSGGDQATLAIVYGNYDYSSALCPAIHSLQDKHPVDQAIQSMKDDADMRTVLSDYNSKYVDVGLALDDDRMAIVLIFEPDLIDWIVKPAITSADKLYMIGNYTNRDVIASHDSSISADVLLLYDPPPKNLTAAQLTHTTCGDTAIGIAAISSRWVFDQYWYTYEPESECPDPYDMSPSKTRITPRGLWSLNNPGCYYIYGEEPVCIPEPFEYIPPPCFYNCPPPEPPDNALPEILADTFHITSGTFTILADISDILDKYGSGIYTVVISGMAKTSSHTTQETVIGTYTIFHDIDIKATTAEDDEPAEALVGGGPTTVSMPEGAGYPDCADADVCFVPSQMVIKTGGNVTWSNHDVVQHSITENSDAPLFDVWVTPEDSFTFTFETPGTYDYRCKVHPWATGTVTVTDADESISESSETTSSDPVIGGPTIVMPEGAGYPDCADTDVCFVPSRMIIETRGNVTWSNHDVVQHTVTEGSASPLFDTWVTPGSSFTFTFETAGTYDYRCKVHPWATGTVTVTDAAEPTGEDLAVERIFEYVDLYKENGVAAFDMITQGAKGAEPDAVVVGYVLDAAEYNLVAHDSNPAFVGFSASALLAKAFIPIEDLGNLLMEEEGNAVPLSYPRPDVQGNIIGYASGQFTYYDGYVFGATFIPTDEELVRGVVAEMIRLYDRDPDGAFDTISSFESTAEAYPFVLDVGTQKRVAHGANPDLVGAVSVVFTNSSVPLATFQTWEDGDSGWAAYTFVKPGETVVSSKISWLVMHDGYLFGAGYYP